MTRKEGLQLGVSLLPGLEQALAVAQIRIAAQQRGAELKIVITVQQRGFGLEQGQADRSQKRRDWRGWSWGWGWGGVVAVVKPTAQSPRAHPLQLGDRQQWLPWALRPVEQTAIALQQALSREALGFGPRPHRGDQSIRAVIQQQRLGVG